MQPPSGAFTMPRFSQACLLGYTPSPQHAFQGDAAHQAQRRTWLTPKDSPGTWYTRWDYRSRWTLRPFHHTVFTAHTWISLPPGWQANLASLLALEIPKHRGPAHPVLLHQGLDRHASQPLIPECPLLAGGELALS